MSKSVIVVSTIVNATVKEYQPDVRFYLFTSLEDLGTFIAEQPLRVEELYFTRDVIPYANTSLVYLLSLLDDPFLTVDKLIYITEENSPELKSIEYLKKDRKLDNLEVITGNLTREYVDGIINGTLREDTIESRRKTVWRVPREEYLKNRDKQQESLEEEYLDDDHYLSDIPDEQAPAEYIPNADEVCSLINLVGDDTQNVRTLFAFISAQYLSAYGKVVLVERDVQYHQLTEYATKSNIQYCFIDIKDILNDIKAVLREIRNTPYNIVVVGAIEKIEYSYHFITQLLYYNLYHDVKFFIRECAFFEAPINQSYVAVINNTIIDTLKLNDGLDSIVSGNARVVAVSENMIKEERFENSTQMQITLTDLAGISPESVVFVTIQSLQLQGNDGCDLRSILL